MAPHAMDGSVQHLVELKQGLISREIFVNAALYQQEQEQIFARTWLFVGHENQIPRPGDFFVSCMGEESVILTRDSRQHIHVFLNTCRHRGCEFYHLMRLDKQTCDWHNNKCNSLYVTQDISKGACQAAGNAVALIRVKINPDATNNVGSRNFQCEKWL